jgi:effector-binding domain-containing protein
MIRDFRLRIGIRKEHTMKKVTMLAVAAVISIAAGLVWAEEKAQGEPAQIVVRQVPAQTVLYTIYRGPYEGIGKPIGELYALAGKNQIIPKGAITLVYLNNPATVSPEHYLTEIRIPVGEEAKKLAGTLGAMTDVKSLRAQDVAVIEKSAGDMDYAGLYRRLHSWIAENGYRVADNGMEVFGGGSADYHMMKSEIMVPIVKTK